MSPTVQAVIAARLRASQARPREDVVVIGVVIGAPSVWYGHLLKQVAIQIR